MGYRIESYTLDELQRVSLPGTAATALFWVIPLGKWPMGTLDNLWYEFTAVEGIWKELGLLLVKRFGEDNSASNANLKALVSSGKLNELLPKGAVKNVARIPSEQRRGFLICSGAYPQPGWGVWVDANRDYKLSHYVRIFS